MCSSLLDASPATSFITIGTSWQFNHFGAFEPFNAYAASKSAFEPFLDSFAQQGLRTASLLLYDTYGPHDPRGKILTNILLALADKSVLEMSSGWQHIDLLHVVDAGYAIVEALKFVDSYSVGCHLRFSIRSGVSITLRDLVLICSRTTGIDPSGRIMFGKRSPRPRERMVLPHIFPIVPGWSPTIPLDIGIRQCFDSLNL